MLPESYRFADPPLDPVPFDRIPDPTRDGQAGTQVWHIVRDAVQEQWTGSLSDATCEHCTELASTMQPHPFRETQLKW